MSSPDRSVVPTGGGVSTVDVHTTADVELSDGTRQRIREAVPANTTRAYARQLAAFRAWCVDRARVALPATPQTLAEYVAHLADKDYAPSTIEQAIAAIRTAHKLAGHKNQPDTDRALLVLRGHRRRRADAGRRAKKAPPLTVESLRDMIATCDLTTLRGLRDRVVLLLGTCMMGRRSELVSLDLDDVNECDEGLCVYLASSKTDQDAEGAELAILYGQHPATCPVRSVRAYRTALADHGVTSGRLIRSIDRYGNVGASITTNSVNNIVRARAVAARLDNAETYTAHSLRAGGATIAYRGGAPVSSIAEHGRWSPGSPVVLGYIRAVDKWKDNPLAGSGL